MTNKMNKNVMYSLQELEKEIKSTERILGLIDSTIKKCMGLNNTNKRKSKKVDSHDLLVETTDLNSLCFEINSIIRKMHENIDQIK